MAASYVQLVTDTANTGKKVDSFELTVGANTVHRQVFAIGDPDTGANVADVIAAGADALTNATLGLHVHQFGYAFNGTAWDRLRTGSAAALAGTTQSFAMMATRPGDWAVNHTPAAATQATISKAAGGAVVRHVCTGISVALVGGAAAPTAATLRFDLRDGATGAGTILQSWTLAIEAVAGKCVTLALSGLNIVGSANTAMTIESSAAPGANITASVNMTGYSVS